MRGQDMSAVAASTRAGRRAWIGLAVLTLPTLLLALDMTVLHLAIPSLSADLRPSSTQLLWILDIYGFLIAGSLITMGTIGDRIGRRRLLLIGAAAFGIASVVAAFSRNAEMLIATRALLGIAGATLMPSTLSLIRNMFVDARQRTMAIGVWMTTFMVGTAIGPLVGGVLLERYWWGSVFLLGVPVMGLLLVAGPILLPESRDTAAGRVDLASAALSLATMLSLVYGIKQIAEHGLGWQPALSIVLGIGFGSVFLARQRTLTQPFLDLSLLRLPTFSAALTTQTLAIFAMAGTQFFVGLYLQLVLGLSPLQAGLWTLPSTAAGVVGTMLAPLIVRRVRPVYVMASGLLLGAAGLGLLTQVDVVTGLPLVVVGFVVISLGLGPTMTLTTDMIIGSAPPERAGSASAISETGGELGVAMGVAVLGSVGTAVYRGRVVELLPPDVPPAALDAARETLAAAVVAAGTLPGAEGEAMLRAVREAFTEGLHVTAAVGAIIVVGIAILAVSMLRHVKVHAASEPEPTPESDDAEEPAVATK